MYLHIVINESITILIDLYKLNLVSTEKVNTTDPGDAEAKARVYYDACIDTNETIEKLGEKPLINIIKKLGGWHILSNTLVKQHKWDLQKLLQDIQNT